MYFRTTIVLAAALSYLRRCGGRQSLSNACVCGCPGPQFSAKSELACQKCICPSYSSPRISNRRPCSHNRALEIVRYVSGEFAKVRMPIPSGKKGFKIEVGKKLDDNELKSALRSHVPAASPGDTVQVTGIEFRNREIVIQINGGGRSRFNIRDHLQVGIGGAGQPLPVSATEQKPPGGTLILDFGRTVPDMSADDLMTDLQAFLDFSKEHSGAVNWIDTLPPEFKQAISDHEARVGMNHEMVLAALGRPEHKVRERDPDGTETEDWIYGTPPARTTFVTFTGDKVIRVKEFD